MKRYALALAVLGLGACSDSGPTPPPPPPPPAPITLTGLPASGATLHQLELTFTVVPNAASTPGTFTITIDGTPAATFGNQYFGTFIVSSVPLANGVHTAHVVISPGSGGSGLDTTFSFTTEIDTKAYLSTPLPPLAGYTAAVANDMNSAGVIVGASTAGNTQSQAVTWTNGVVAALPTTGGLQTTANAINTQGDIAGSVNTDPPSAALWRPGDTLRVIGTVQYGERINDAGQVLLDIGRSYAPVALYDIGTGSTTDVWANDSTNVGTSMAIDMNSSGQVLGYDQNLEGTSKPVVTSGLALPTKLPQPNVVEPDSYLNRPVDLNDHGDILLDYNGWWVLGSGSATTFLNAYLGGAPGFPNYGARINNEGQVVALLNGKLYLWDKTTQMTQRIDAGASWTFDQITYFGDDGKILVHGTDSESGTTAALLLTPQ